MSTLGTKKAVVVANSNKYKSIDDRRLALLATAKFTREHLRSIVNGEEVVGYSPRQGWLKWDDDISVITVTPRLATMAALWDEKLNAFESREFDESDPNKPCWEVAEEYLDGLIADLESEDPAIMKQIKDGVTKRQRARKVEDIKPKRIIPYYRED